MIKKYIVVLLCILCVMVTPCMAKSNDFIQLEQGQTQSLDIAYKYGNEIEFRGDTWGETSAAIIYQESHANRTVFQTNGIVVGDLNRKGHPRSLGPAQVQVGNINMPMSMWP